MSVCGGGWVWGGGGGGGGGGATVGYGQIECCQVKVLKLKLLFSYINILIHIN